MKYTSKDIQNILTSKTAINGLDYITPIYQEAKIALWIMEAMGLEVDLIVKWIEEIVQQILPQTADWALNYWEQEYDLPVHPDIPIEERREKVLTAVRTRAPMNPEKLEEVLEIIFKIEKAKVIERTAKNTFEVQLYKQFLEDEWAVVFKTIEKYKPAHLILEAKSILETPFSIECFIDGVVFGPVLETILPETETIYDFQTTAQIVSDYCSIESTGLPEMMLERRR